MESSVLCPVVTIAMLVSALSSDYVTNMYGKWCRVSCDDHTAVLVSALLSDYVTNMHEEQCLVSCDDHSYVGLCSVFRPRDQHARRVVSCVL